MMWSQLNTKYTESDKYRYSGYGIGFDVRSQFSWSDGTWDKKNFGADMSSSVHDDNKNKDIFVFGEGLTQGLDDTTITAEVKYPINFTRYGKKIVLSLHYNGSNNFLFVNAVKMYQFKGNYSE